MGTRKRKVVAIGDIHGHYDQMMDLLQNLRDEGVDFEEDTLVFLGDYVDGGPDVKRVIDELIILKERYPHWRFLFGNHESLLLDALNPSHPIYGDYYLWWNQGGQATLESYKPSQSLSPDEYERYQRAIMQPEELIPEEHLNFIKELDLYSQSGDYFFVHAGLYPGRSIEDHEISIKEAYPLGFHPGLMIEGDMAYDMIWIREPFIGSDWDWKKKIIFGHTVFPYREYVTAEDEYGPIYRPGHPFVKNNQIGIDGMAHETGRLIAVILPEEKFVYSKWSEDML